MKGTVGRVARVLPENGPFVYSPQISFWRVLDKDLLDSGYLSFWLRSPSFTEQAFAAKSDADMADYINLTDQRQMTIRLPPIEDQRRISAVLSALEGLIEINERQLAIRDLLLPRLVTGTLDISDVDLGIIEPTEAD